jgi:hypothetical protein
MLLEEGTLVNGVPASDLSRCERPPNKDMLRLYIKANALRSGSQQNSPWVVDTPLVKKYSLPSRFADFFVSPEKLKEAAKQVASEKKRKPSLNNIDQKGPKKQKKQSDTENTQALHNYTKASPQTKKNLAMATSKKVDHKTSKPSAVNHKGASVPGSPLSTVMSSILPNNLMPLKEISSSQLDHSYSSPTKKGLKLLKKSPEAKRSPSKSPTSMKKLEKSPKSNEKKIMKLLEAKDKKYKELKEHVKSSPSKDGNKGSVKKEGTDSAVKTEKKKKKDSSSSSSSKSGDKKDGKVKKRKISEGAKGGEKKKLKKDDKKKKKVKSPKKEVKSPKKEHSSPKKSSSSSKSSSPKKSSPKKGSSPTKKKVKSPKKTAVTAKKIKLNKKSPDKKTKDKKKSPKKSETSEKSGTKKKMKQMTLFEMSMKKGGAATSSSSPKKQAPASPKKRLLPLPNFVKELTQLLIRKNPPLTDLERKKVIGLTGRAMKILTPAHYPSMHPVLQERLKHQAERLEFKRKLKAMTPDERKTFFKRKKITEATEGAADENRTN